jgi:hypothetical protein
MNAPLNFMTVKQYAEQNALTIKQVQDLLYNKRLEYSKIGGKIYIPYDAQPIKIDFDKEEWLTVQELAEKCKMSVQWAYRQFNLGNLESRRINGRVMVKSQVNLVRFERQLRSGRIFVYWEVVKDSKVQTKTA